jgi:hypothetical protein
MRNSLETLQAVVLANILQLFLFSMHSYTTLFFICRHEKIVNLESKIKSAMSV